MQVGDIRAPTTSVGALFVGAISAVFAAIGTFMAYRTASTLLQLAFMLTWPTTPASLQSVELRTGPAATSRSQSVVAQYTYRVDGRPYTGHRVSIYSPDNLGTFHEDTYQELHDHLMRNAPYPLHVNPRAPEESILFPVLRWEAIGFYLLLTLVFGGVGWTLLVLTVTGWRQRNTEAALVAQYPGQKWRHRTLWSGASYRSSGLPKAVSATCVALLWNASSLPLLTVVPREALNGHYIAWIFLAFPLIGLGMLAWALVSIARARRFQGTALLLTDVPGRQGEPLRGRIEASNALSAAGQVVLGLRCERRRWSSTLKSRQLDREVLWQQESVAGVQPGPTNEGRVRVAFEFSIPAQWPDSRWEGDEQVAWLLSAKAPLRGADFEAEFEIPVFHR